MDFYDNDTNDIEFTMTISVDDALKGLISDGIEEMIKFNFTGTADQIKDWLNDLEFIPSEYSKNPLNFIDRPNFLLSVDDGFTISQKTLSITFANDVISQTGR